MTKNSKIQVMDNNGMALRWVSTLRNNGEVVTNIQPSANN
ncbi:hypothetical protein GPLA_2053 [Paraglaciecola polaris LMG 21857]|uniref:Uncharacterized protein n=1 Tax=Paraglaciecola polaris LMG 21857 TaxID=1129793 RepID=K6ZVZ5_9ALTE|nr:hypothetical protein GPLA_2053 [Paraglaciecola polaris LMG 21857]